MAKYPPLALICALLFTSCNPSSPGNPDPPAPQGLWVDNPSCPIDRSRLVEVKRVKSNDTTEVTRYKYDDQFRLIEFESDPSNTYKIHYINDKLVRSEYIGLHDNFFDNNGHHVKSTVWHNKPVPTFSHEIHRKYNSSGEVYEYSYTDTSRQIFDTMLVIWVDGNIVQAKGKHNDEVYRYEYFLDTDGRSFLSQVENIGVQDYSIHFWMVFPAAKQAYSKNFLKRRIYKTAGTENILDKIPFFDEDGRVNHMIETVTINGKVTSVDTLFCKYECH